MKIQKSLGYIALFATAGMLAFPVSALADDTMPATTSDSTAPATTDSSAMQESTPKAKVHHKKHYKKHGCRKHYKNYKKYCCKRWCYSHKVCQIKPAHWWGLTWFPTSKECFWVR